MVSDQVKYQGDDQLLRDVSDLRKGVCQPCFFVALYLYCSSYKRGRERRPSCLETPIEREKRRSIPVVGQGHHETARLNFCSHQKLFSEMAIQLIDSSYKIEAEYREMSPCAGKCYLRYWSSCCYTWIRPFSWCNW